LDPSVRVAITILSGDLPSPLYLAPRVNSNTSTTTINGCQCFCIGCCKQGDASLECAIDRSYLAPGDTFYFTCKALNNTPENAFVRVTLIMYGRLKAEGHQQTRSHKYDLASYPCNGFENCIISKPRPIIVPYISPTFTTNKREDRTLFSKEQVDPFTWWYMLEVRLDMPGCFATDIIWKCPVEVGAWPVSILSEMYPKDYAEILAPVVQEPLSELTDEIDSKYQFKQLPKVFSIFMILKHMM